MVRKNLLIKLNILKILVAKKIQLYQEPDIDEQGKYIKKPLGEDQEKIKLNIPLKEGVLKTNCGIPIVFVINKSDVITQSSEKKKLIENSEFILTHIRSIAIEYGATIVYTSGKTNCNLTILYDYICHILFNFDLIHKPNLIDKEAYFIPAGYDNLTLLESNDEKNNYLKESYENKIKPKLINKTNKEGDNKDIQCEDTNTFFETLKQMGIKDNTTKNKLLTANSFVEYKKKNFDIPDIKNYETNISSNKNVTNIADKDKKYEDTRKAIKEKIGTNASFTKRDIKNKELKGKEDNDAKKKKIREDMLAKIKQKKISKPGTTKNNK